MDSHKIYVLFRRTNYNRMKAPNFPCLIVISNYLFCEYLGTLKASIFPPDIWLAAVRHFYPFYIQRSLRRIDMTTGTTIKQHFMRTTQLPTWTNVFRNSKSQKQMATTPVLLEHDANATNFHSNQINSKAQLKLTNIFTPVESRFSIVFVAVPVPDRNSVVLSDCAPLRWELVYQLKWHNEDAMEKEERPKNEKKKYRSWDSSLSLSFLLFRFIFIVLFCFLLDATDTHTHPYILIRQFTPLKCRWMRLSRKLCGILINGGNAQHSIYLLYSRNDARNYLDDVVAQMRPRQRMT